MARRDQAVPTAVIIAGDRFGNRRQIAEQGAAFGQAMAEGAQAAAFHQRPDGGRWCHRPMRFASHYGGHRGAATFVWNMERGKAPHTGEQYTGQMALRARTCRRHIGLLSRFAVSDEVADGFYWQCWLHGQYVGRDRKERNVFIGVDKIGRLFLMYPRRYRERGGRCTDQRVAVGRRVFTELHAQGAACTGAVINHHLLAQLGGETHRNQSRQYIDAAARGIGDNQPDRASRIFGGRCILRCVDRSEHNRRQADDGLRVHVVPPRCVVLVDVARVPKDHSGVFDGIGQALALAARSRRMPGALNLQGPFVSIDRPRYTSCDMQAQRSRTVSHRALAKRVFERREVICQK